MSREAPCPPCSQGRMDISFHFQSSQVPPVGSVWWGLGPLPSRLLAVCELEVQRAQPHGTPPRVLHSFGGEERKSCGVPLPSWGAGLGTCELPSWSSRGLAVAPRSPAPLPSSSQPAFCLPRFGVQILPFL